MCLPRTRRYLNRQPKMLSAHAERDVLEDHIISEVSIFVVPHENSGETRTPCQLVNSKQASIKDNTSNDYIKLKLRSVVLLEQNISTSAIYTFQIYVYLPVQVFPLPR